MTGFVEVFHWRRALRGWGVGLLLMSCLVHCAAVVNVISAPHDLVALTSDLTVIYEYSSEVSSPVYLQLADKISNTEIARSVELTQLSGEVVFGCEHFHQSGIFVVRMRATTDNDVITESDDITITWPTFSFVLPDEPRTFSNLEITSQSGESICATSINNLYIVLEYRASNTDSPDRVRTPIEQLNNGNFVGEFPCDVVTREGFYMIKLEYSNLDSFIVSTSQIFKITQSPSIELILPAELDSLDGCHGDLNISYSYSESCHFVPGNIAVFAVTSPAAVSFIDPSSLDLELAEEHESRNGSEVSIDCGVFETSIYQGYCFKYRGIDESGKTIEAAVRCLPSRQNMGGTWGPWTEWEPCTATCGESRRRRTRICLEGEECNGNPYHVSDCEVPRCLDDIPRVVARDVDSGPVNPSSCNHVLSTPTGNLSASPRACPSGATWIIRVAPNKRIRLKFTTFNLYLPQEYVRIRDGVNARARILAFNTGQLVPGSVTSSGNQIYVEYEVFDKGKPPIRGFTATYTSIALPKPKPSVPAALAETDDDAGGLAGHTTIVLAVGVSLLVLLLVFSLVMTIIIRFKEERHDYRGGTIQKIYTGPSGGSFNSSTTRSNQRLFGAGGVPGHSTTSPSEHSHQSVSKRGFPDGNGNGDRSQMYLIPENTNMQYLPETALSSPLKSNSEIQSVSELPSPYKDETGPKWPVAKKDMSLPFHFGDPRQSNEEDISRQSVLTDKNTVHLANRTPSEFATRGYSARGSAKGSRSSIDSRQPDVTRQKRVHANVENSDNTSPFLTPNGELTNQGLKATSKGSLKRPTRLNRSPEGAESPDAFDPEGTLTRHHRSDHSRRDDGRSSDKKHHRSHRSGNRSSKSGLSSDAGVYSPESTADRSTGSRSGSGRHSKSHRHHHHHGSGKRHKSPSNEERISMKEIDPSNRSPHRRRKHSPASSRSRHSDGRSRHSEGKDPRSPKSVSSSGSTKKHRSTSGSRSPSRHAGKVYSPSTSENSRYNSLPYSRGKEYPLGDQSPISEASPIRLPKPLSIKQNRDQYKHVFISDESLMNRVSGTDRSGAESSQRGNANKHFANTPSSGSASPTKSLNVRRVYSDKSISPEEPAFDNYMPSIPGSYFENPYPQPVPNGPPTENLAVV